MTFEEWFDSTRGKSYNSATVLIREAWNTAVAAERDACAQMVDHIYREGGGTYGDAIRMRVEK